VGNHDPSEDPGRGEPVAALATASAARHDRGRRAARRSGDERERAILETAERLLAQRPIGEISVDDLARGAGISRPAFYFYFPSKTAVVLTLVDRMVEQARTFKEQTARQLPSDPGGSWRKVIEVFYEIFGAHRAVIRAAADLAATEQEARQVWSQMMEAWVREAQERIESERARGAAPAGVDARDLATALIQMNEGVLRAIFVEDDPAVAEPAAIETLAHIWLNAIYGTADPRGEAGY
jgi:TetR/AcrR family transcriptional regulator, ethionamide resistance regulator